MNKLFKIFPVVHEPTSFRLTVRSTYIFLDTAES